MGESQLSLQRGILRRTLQPGRGVQDSCLSDTKRLRQTWLDPSLRVCKMGAPGQHPFICRQQKLSSN